MALVRTTTNEAIRPLHVVMICLVAVTVAGGSLLLSAAGPVAPVDGAIPWREESPLRAVVGLLCLNYEVPTIYAGDVKNYILGIGAGLAILSLTIAIVVGSPTRVRDSGTSDVPVSPEAPPQVEELRPSRRLHVAPLIAAQVLVGLYLLWSFASSRWLWAPELALGASILLTVQFLWVLGIGNGLSSSAAHIASRAVVGIGVATAAVAVWYHYGRNPTLRADFPVGNPSFLAACLIPVILLGAAYICEAVLRAVRTHRAGYVGFAVLACASVGVCLWAFYLADARGPWIGLVFGALAMAFFALPRWSKLVPVALAAAITLGGWFYLSTASDAFSPTGRSATARLRMYAWTYAWNMFREKPLTGHGQGAFVLVGDSQAVHDVLDDPLVFESRIAHAHNEWLQVMADLGAAGIVLVAAALLLTLRAGAAALSLSPLLGHRWTLIALMGALVGLIVEEAFGVGLRVSGVPTVFYTVIGLIWALSGYGGAGLPDRLSATRGRRIITGVVGGVIALTALAVTQEDFAAARSSYRADEALLKDDYEEGIRLALAATDQLNPQRALTNLQRLAGAYLRAAEYLHERARDRERRAREAEMPNPMLLALAEEDYRFSDERCEQGSGALKELVLRSPGFINHGRLEYRLNLTRARNAAARNDVEKEQALLKNAAAAIQRELLRQPFDPSMTIEYLRIAGATLDLPETIRLLARPLRHNRVTESYLRFLRQFAADPQFDAGFEPIFMEAARALTVLPGYAPPADTVEVWAPEKLRLAAAIRFLRGDYAEARDVLQVAAAGYDALATSAPFGAASCHGELAVCQFFSDPDDPAAALASASHAIASAPQSRSGRELKLSVKQRMVDYCLADNDEEMAKQLLRETGPQGVAEGAVLSELGVRYRTLCESLLDRREAGGVLRKPPADLTPKLQRWARRAVELNPDDPYAHYMAADLAFYVGDDVATAEHLRSALRYGLPPEQVMDFLLTARDRKPDSQALNELWHALVPQELLEGPPYEPESPGKPPPAHSQTETERR
jgi:O-antigen ligase